MPLPEGTHGIRRRAHDRLLVDVEARVDDARQPGALHEFTNDPVIARIVLARYELRSSGAINMHDARSTLVHLSRAIESDGHEPGAVSRAAQPLIAALCMLGQSRGRKRHELRTRQALIQPVIHGWI